MTHRKQDSELVEILQLSCADGDDVLCALLAYTLQQSVKLYTLVVEKYKNYEIPFT